MLVEIQRFMKRLKEEQTAISRDALVKPSDKTEFGYGEACGRYKGLLKAEELLKEVLEETDNDERSK